MRFGASKIIGKEEKNLSHFFVEMTNLQWVQPSVHGVSFRLTLEGVN